MALLQESEIPDPITLIRNLGDIQCGRDAAKHFLHHAAHTNLNHGAYRPRCLQTHGILFSLTTGSFGTYPKEVRQVFRYYQERSEARPDAFVRYEYRAHLLRESRDAIAEYLNVPAECCVYVPNASTGFDTILHNLNYKPGDVIIGFPWIYESCANTVQYITETTSAEFKQINVPHPATDEWICDAFEQTVKELLALGKNPKVAVFDTVTSLPALRMPFERLTELCRSYGILSLIDGAHGVGMIPLQLQQLDADFFVSNCHKWFYTPRACAVMYIPPRNQHLLRVTFPTGPGFVPFPSEEHDRTRIPNNFVTNFSSLGTRDETPYLCVRAAMEWRAKLVWKEKRGEEAAMAYMHYLADQGGLIVAAILGTEVLQLRKASPMTNVRLPLSMEGLAWRKASDPSEIFSWIMKEMMLRFDTAINITWYCGAFWARLSAQVYLTLEDFEALGTHLKTICEEALQHN